MRTKAPERAVTANRSVVVVVGFWLLVLSFCLLISWLVDYKDWVVGLLGGWWFVSVGCWLLVVVGLLVVGCL